MHIVTPQGQEGGARCTLQLNLSLIFSLVLMNLIQADQDEDVLVEDVPVEDVPVEDVPVEDVPVEDVPLEDVPVE